MLRVDQYTTFTPFLDLLTAAPTRGLGGGFGCCKSHALKPVTSAAGPASLAAIGRAGGERRAAQKARHRGEKEPQPRFGPAPDLMLVQQKQAREGPVDTSVNYVGVDPARNITLDQHEAGERPETTTDVPGLFYAVRRKIDTHATTRCFFPARPPTPRPWSLDAPSPPPRTPHTAHAPSLAHRGLLPSRRASRVPRALPLLSLSRPHRAPRSSLSSADHSGR